MIKIPTRRIVQICKHFEKWKWKVKKWTFDDTIKNRIVKSSQYIKQWFKYSSQKQFEIISRPINIVLIKFAKNKYSSRIWVKTKIMNIGLRKLALNLKRIVRLGEVIEKWMERYQIWVHYKKILRINSRKYFWNKIVQQLEHCLESKYLRIFDREKYPNQRQDRMSKFSEN